MNKLLEQLWALALRPQAERWLAPAVAVWLACLAWMRFLHLPDEGRYVGVAWDMLRADSPWVPLINGLPYFHKPPLFYWLSQFSFAVFGVHEWSARVAPVLAACVAAMALFGFVRKYRGPRVAVLTLGILVTMPLFYGGAQYANLDMLVAGMMTITVLAGAEAVFRHESGQLWRSMSILAGVFAALSILAKGLIGIVLPGGVLFFWLILSGRWRKLGVLLWPPALLAFLVVVLPWFVLMQNLYPGFFNYFFVYQHFERFVSESFNNTQPFWFYIPLVLSMTLPWSLAAVGFFTGSFWRRSNSQLNSLMWCWLAVMVVFFSIPASKLIGYILPVLFPLAVLLAEVVAIYLDTTTAKMVVLRPHIRRAVRTCFVIAVFVCLTTLIVFRFNQKDSGANMGARIASELKADDTFLFLKSYPFDLPLYSGMRKPAWVVENWPALVQRDNWRNELADAAQFNPELGREVLVNSDALLPRLCKTSDQVFWVRADADEWPAWGFIKDVQPFVREDNEAMVWKIKTDQAFKAKFCQ